MLITLLYINNLPIEKGLDDFGFVFLIKVTMLHKLLLALPAIWRLPKSKKLPLLRDERRVRASAHHLHNFVGNELREAFDWQLRYIRIFLKFNGFFGIFSNLQFRRMGKKL